MKALITGSEGFIGKHLTTELRENGYEVYRCDLRMADGVIPLNILDIEQTKKVILEHTPDILINMAGQADVGISWKSPQFTVEVNAIGMINILEAVRVIDPQIRVIAIGSSDEYGVLKEKGKNVTENIPINPMTPYAISKQAQEQFAQLYNCAYGMNVCMTRQFNLGGAGQAKGFLLSDFASGIVEIEKGLKDSLLVGNLSSARDFTHVKDACRAIRLIAEKGHPGEVYNICSGKTYTVQEILNHMLEMTNTDVTIKQDPSRMRPSDTPLICGNHDKLTEHTGWEPELGLDEMLSDIFDYWRRQ